MHLLFAPSSHRGPALGRTFLTLLALLALGCGDDDEMGAADSGAADQGRDAAMADVGRDAADAAADDGVEDSGTSPGMDGGAADASVDVGEDMGAIPCGDGTIDVSRIRGTEGLAIAPDGTLFFSQSGGVGRVRVDGTIEADWLTGLPRTVWGLGYRASDDTLFVASPGNRGVVYAVDGQSDAPSAEVLAQGLGAPNGLIVLDDGSVVVSDFDVGRIYRIVDADTVDQVNTSTIRGPNGLLLDDDGTLLVLAYFSGEVLRLELNASFEETARSTVVTLRANPDGIAKDDEGRYYITDNGGGRLLRLDADFEGEELLLSRVPAAANVAFGAGRLSCTDLYVTSSDGMQVLDVGASGRP